jgi:ParB family chromosome partitioning protein
MRAHHQADFRFLIEPRELTDEEAFRIADLENRSRRDLSDYERARDYARAVDRYYGGSQQRMAERLEVSKSWLSRYLSLAQLPREVVAAFASPHAIGIKHAAVLTPMLRIDEQADRVRGEARLIAGDQAERSTRGEIPLAPAAVMQRLTAAGRAQSGVRPTGGRREHTVRSSEGHIVASGRQEERGGGVTIRLPSPTRHARAALVKAVGEILDQLGRGGRGTRAGRTDDNGTPPASVASQAGDP